MYVFVRRKVKNLRICQVLRLQKNFGSANRKNIGYADRKSANCHICRRSANVTNFVSPQICGFALWTAHLCKLAICINNTSGIGGKVYCRCCGAGVLLSRTFSSGWLLLAPPPPLGWNLANAGNTKTVENNRNWAELLLHDVYFIRSKDSQIHNNHGCKTTINWFRRTCNESKITLYYWLYTMLIMQFTDLLIVHFFSFFSCFGACLFHWLWKPAK